MSTYVISDIHGCYNEFLSMLEKIYFSESDNLVLAGDYIDRGKQSYEMLKWMEQCPPNVLLLRGNHEEEFVSNVDLMQSVDRIDELNTDFSSHMDTAVLYESVKYLLRQKKLHAVYFDLYGTIGMLLGKTMLRCMICADGRKQSARCPIIGKQRLRVEIILPFMPDMLIACRILADGLTV